MNENSAQRSKLASVTGFINRLNSFVSNSGIIDQNLLEKHGYMDTGFVISLAKWQGEYNHTVVQRMAYGLNGKKLNSISQNSTITHIIDALNTNNNTLSKHVENSGNTGASNKSSVFNGYFNSIN